MYRITPVTGHIGGECYLLTTDKSAVLLDAGFDFCADRAAENIRAVLGDRPLDYILATHSHYDHMSGAAAIKRHFPMVEVVASPYARKVLASANARELMRSLNAACARDAGLGVPDDRIGELAVDIALEDGEELRLPDMTIRALATPGHTRCAMSYYFREEGLLVCSETLGIAPAYPEVTPCFIVGCRSTLDSIERSRALEPKRVFVSHLGLLPEGESGRFFEYARRGVEKAAALLLELHDRGCDEDAIVEAFIDAFYYPTADIQPRRAFVLNTRALIPRILEEFGRAPRKTA